MDARNSEHARYGNGTRHVAKQSHAEARGSRRGGMGFDGITGDVSDEAMKIHREQTQAPPSASNKPASLRFNQPNRKEAE